MFTTPAILLRRTDYGDFDLIVTVFSREKGKLALMAKSGKKSKKRFGGILELFAELEIVGRFGRRGDLALLQEANLIDAFANIRSDVQKTAYASYWVELVNAWAEEQVRMDPLYALLQHVLAALDSGRGVDHELSILFQMRLLKFSGHSPNLRHCVVCRKELEALVQSDVGLSMQAGGVVCRGCADANAPRLSKATLKQLLWVESGDLAKAGRVRFSQTGVREALAFLEAFVPYHLGRQPRSLKFLRQIRKPAA